MPASLPPLLWISGEPRDVSHAEPIGEGDSFACYLLEGIEARSVLRLAKHATATAALRRELYLLPLLQQHIDVEIPLIDTWGTRLDSGEGFSTYPLVPGEPVACVALAEMDTSGRVSLLRQMARFITQLHSFPIEKAHGVSELVPTEYIAGLLTEADETLSSRLDREVWLYHRRLAERYLATPDLHSYRPSLIHGDLSPDHFLVDWARCALTGVIDFSDCCISDPLWDFMHILENYGGAILETLLPDQAKDERLAALKRIRIYRELNSLQFCLSRLAEGDDAEFTEGMQRLITQASAGVDGDPSWLD